MKTAIKRLYNYIPFKQTIFKALKKVWQPKESVYRHLHFTGIIDIPVAGREFKMHHYGYEVENEIFWAGLLGNWEKVSLGLWIKLCKNSDVIFDIGANTGVYSLIAKTVNPDSSVYAFEPVKRVFEKLKENIELNNFNIHSYEKAVSNSDGTAVIYDTETEHTYSVTVNKNLNSADTHVKSVTIETIMLDSFIQENKINKIDLIKIDVETHEPEVLEGFSQFISKFKPTILIEILQEEVGAKVNDLVKDMDYLYFNIDELAGIRQVDKITRSDYYNYLICSKEIAKSLALIK